MGKMVKLETSGSFKHTFNFFDRVQRKAMYKKLEKYGEEGVAALSSATPVDTGLTAASWGYEIKMTANRLNISWWNTNINEGVPIALIIQYGHATGNGGWVEGVDYINPALKPIFDEIEKKVWREVTR